MSIGDATAFAFTHGRSAGMLMQQERWDIDISLVFTILPGCSDGSSVGRNADALTVPCCAPERSRGPHRNAEAAGTLAPSHFSGFYNSFTLPHSHFIVFYNVFTRANPEATTRISAWRANSRMLKMYGFPLVLQHFLKFQGGDEGD